MDILPGWKRYIGLAVGAGAAAALALGYIDAEVAAWIGGVGAAVFGAGWIEAQKRGQSIANDLLAAIRDQAPKLIVAGLLGLAFMTPSPALAKDCSFDDGDVNAEVFRVGFPLAVGFNLAAADFEAGILRDGEFGCAAATANPLVLFCMIPKLGPLLEGASVCTNPFKASEPEVTGAALPVGG